MLTALQRIIHGSFKSGRSYDSQKHSSLSPRPDTSRLTASLPCRAPARAYYTNSMPYRTRTPNSFRSFTPRTIERASRNSNYQDSSSPSVESIVEMYREPAISDLSDPPRCPTRSLYSDDSEEPENDLASPQASLIPPSPTSQRVPSPGPSMMMETEEQTSPKAPGCYPDSDKAKGHSNKSKL